MGFDQYHEPPEDLSQKVRTFARMQGYLPILSLCQQVVLGLAPMNVDTGAGFVTPQNYEIVSELAKQALR